MANIKWVILPNKCALFKQLLIGKGLQMTFTDMVVVGMEVRGCFCLMSGMFWGSG